MIKVVTKKYRFYSKCQSNLRWRNKVCFDLSRIDSLSDSIEFKHVISAVQLNNGTFKTTAQDRFEDLDIALLQLLEEYFSESIHIHDMAVSDGITTFELFEKLEKSKIQFKMVASDRFNKILVNESLAGCIKRNYDAEGVFLNGAAFGIYADSKVQSKYRISKWLGDVLKKKQFVGNQSREVLLINPVLRQPRVFNQITFEDFNIFDFRVDQPFDVVRSMNILNRKYFSDEQLKQALEQIFQSMKPGGLLLVGRTNKDTGVNDASFYIKEDIAFKEVQVLNAGSEVGDLVLALGKS